MGCWVQELHKCQEREDAVVEFYFGALKAAQALPQKYSCGGKFCGDSLLHHMVAAKIPTWLQTIWSLREALALLHLHSRVII